MPFLVTTPANLDILQYDYATTKWKNVTLATADIASLATATTHYAKTVNEANTDTTKDKHISNALAKSYSDHLASLSNPHTVTHTQVGSATAQWNANKLQGISVSASTPTNGYALVYNSGTTALEYVAITGVDTTFTIKNTASPTKLMRFDASGITAGQTRVITAPDADIVLCGIATTQTLTNKTFDDALTMKHIATPSNPASGYKKLYFKTDGLLYKLDSSGVETAI